MKKLALVLVVLSFFTIALASANEKVVYSTGFEDDTWSPLPQNWSYATDIAHSGQRSLHVDVSSPDQYSFPDVKIPCEPGKEYTLSFWVKTGNVIDHKIDPQAYWGATACIQAMSKTGQWVDGFYAIRGLLGTNDWEKVTHSFIIPEHLEGNDITLVLYLRKGLSGKAWFDDVQITTKSQPAFQCRLLSPKHRTMHLSNPVTVELSTRIDLSDEEELPPSWFLMLELKKMGKKESLKEIKYCELKGEESLIKFALGDLEEDVPYELVVSLKDNDRTIASREFSFINLSEELIPQATVLDEKGNLIVNGEPFFPLGWYVSDVPANVDKYIPSYKKLKDASFNVLVNYNINYGSLGEIERYLDSLSSVGLKTIYSLKDFFPGTPWYFDQVGPFKGEENVIKGLVSTFKDHPAILGWYISDELRDRVSDNERHNQWIWEEDYKHPTWLLSCLPQELKKLDRGADVFGVDPYPVPDRPLTYVSDWMNTAYSHSGDKPVWGVIQVHGYIYYDGTGREPTFPEIKAMSYLALVNGAKGLIYYSLFDLRKSPDYPNRWDSIANLNQEISELVPFFLHGERVKLHSLTEGFEGALFKNEQEGLLIIINHTGQEREFSLDLKEQVGIGSRLQEKNGSQEMEINDDILKDHFAPFAVHIYNFKL